MYDKDLIGLCPAGYKQLWSVPRGFSIPGHVSRVGPDYAGSKYPTGDKVFTITGAKFVLVRWCCHNGSNTTFIRNPVMDEERMRPEDCLRPDFMLPLVL